MNPWKWNIANSLWINSTTGETLSAEEMDSRRGDRIAYLEADIAALREMAERVQEGETCNLAQFILLRTDEIKIGSNVFRKPVMATNLQEVMDLAQLAMRCLESIPDGIYTPALDEDITMAFNILDDATWPTLESSD